MESCKRKSISYDIYPQPVLEQIEDMKMAGIPDLKLLPQELAAVITLHYHANMTIKEVSVTLNIPHRTASRRLKTALLTLKNMTK